MTYVILDTNLLSLIAVGAADRRGVAKHKRLQAFTVEDYDAVVGLLPDLPHVVLCPHVLAETSNIIRQTAAPLRQAAAAKLAEIMSVCDEQNVPSEIVARHPYYLGLGVTDAVLLTLAETRGTLLTVDLDLYLAAESGGYQVVNYNHLRDI